jgi:hypothetical protein
MQAPTTVGVVAADAERSWPRNATAILPGHF